MSEEKDGSEPVEEKAKELDYYIWKSFVEDGIFQAIRVFKRAFGDDMNFDLTDQTMRMSIWQITHSLDKLETRTMTSIDSMEKLLISVGSKDPYTDTIAKHLVNAIESLEEYVLGQEEDAFDIDSA